ncbi:MAG: glycoside hydrolase family 25 protein [Eubacterium sp.]
MATTTKQKKKKKPTTKKRKNSITQKLKALPNSKKTAISVCIFFLVIVIVLVGVAVHNSNHTHNMLSLDKDVAQGIDVSHHNGKIDWKKVSRDADFAIVRVGYRGYSEGEINPDTYAKHNLRNAQRAGVPLGVYFYSQAITPQEARQEARYALKVIKGYDVSLPVFIDCEFAGDSNGHTGRLYNAGLSRDEMTDIANAFCEEIKKAGYTPGVYASTYFYESVFDAKNITRNAVIWVADYNRSITYEGKYDIWQATDKGKCDGVNSKGVDIDYWYLKK